LLWEFWRLIIESKANAFLFENVPSILHPRNLTTFQEFCAIAGASGFKTNFLKANATEYGVAQRRERVFLIGVKGQTPRIPRPTHGGGPQQLTFRLPPVSAGEVLKPFRGAEYFEPEEVVFGRWAEHLKQIPPGMNYKALTAWAGHSSPSFVAETRFWSFLLKLHPALPSWTIAAAPGPWTGPFHWENRRLRTPELAALQGFPQEYFFEGTRRDRVRQIGNALPPPLAAKMFRPILDILSGEELSPKSAQSS
jgi:DNA (cytosine-5)-methyltransferase 1